MPRNCVNSPDNFCYICGEVTFSTRKRLLTPMVKKLVKSISVANSETKTKNGLLMAGCKHLILIAILRTGDSLYNSSKSSLKAVLLHIDNTLPYIPIDNTLPYIPIGHSVHNKESCEDIKILVEAINYDKFKWQICDDLKVTALLLGL
jgi:hypothetical protein